MKRYDMPRGSTISEAADGEWIRYEDHVEAMKRIAGDSAQQAEPVAWFEADESARGGDIRALVRSLVHSTRWHWQSERPVTGNPVWPLYAAHAPSASPAYDVKNEVGLSLRDYDQIEADAERMTASPAALTDEQITTIWLNNGGSLNGNNYRAFARALLAASPADQVGWIPVSERLPDAAGEYLVYRPDAHRKPAADPNTCIREYTPGRRPTADGWGGVHRVTHWMPLPSAPMSATPPAAEGE